MAKLEPDVIEKFNVLENDYHNLNYSLENRCFEIVDFILNLSKSEQGDGWTGYSICNDEYDEETYFSVSMYSKDVEFSLHHFGYISDLYAIINGEEYKLVDSAYKSAQFPTEFIYQDFEEILNDGVNKWRVLNPHRVLLSYGTPSEKQQEKKLEEAKADLIYYRKLVQKAEDIVRELSKE